MFDPRKQTPNFHNHILDPVTTLTNSYDSWEPHNFDFQVSQKLGNKFRVQKLEDHEDDDGVESGASSPPLWQNTSPRSPVHPINYRSLSPSSRTQAIARGQWELMEMVKNMPESCFELSLKDLVEHPKSFESQENCLVNKEKNKVVQNRVKIKKNDDIRKAKMMRSKSTIENGGLFLKMVSPVSLGSNKKKKNKKNSSVNITRVSPKPEECENSTKSMEKEWWKKRFSSSSSGSSSNISGSTGRNTSTGCSSSSSNSTNSRNNSNRKRKGMLRSCWSSLCFSNSISAG
ncbi:hypothetical protein K7X08_004766 [Anisodus acutangulus]|uniref:Uncharacterized protein n=1 Tax=Anisodus acutangulus TaxID=402998 RepID=A0A9Q1RIT8_9SOLA|nr:hypothetical protein K7X08_004766 [Anisodus acutangulus]